MYKSYASFSSVRFVYDLWDAYISQVTDELLFIMSGYYEQRLKWIMNNDLNGRNLININ